MKMLIEHQRPKKVYQRGYYIYREVENIYEKKRIGRDDHQKGR